LWLSRQPSVLEKGDPGSPIRERVASIVVAPGKDDRQLLNEAIRERLKAAGVLSGQTATVETLTRKDLTSVQQLRAENYQAGDVLKAGRAYRKWGIEKGDYVRVIGGDGQRNLLRVQTASGREAEINPRTARRFQVFESGQRELQAGDRIVFRENDHPLSRKNGLAAEVLQVHGDRAIVKTETGEVQRIDFKSLRDGHWTHAYAQTAHESQGRTCDRVFVHAESNRLKLTNQQSFYVSISRAKEQAHVFTDNAEALGLAVAARSGQKTQALHASHERGAGMSL
ncbi:MAG: hypothetical protein KUL88_07310, partial [Rhizobium sp.]|nr:hypothetical protein [Rhizobium sp.]